MASASPTAAAAAAPATSKANDFLSTDFVDLFDPNDDDAPQWTLEDVHNMHQLQGVEALPQAPFQRLPVEIIESIAHQLVQFRDIKALGSSCSYFRKVIFDSKNHLFWYKWSKAPHSMCRWDLGYYRQNREYQNTIVRQQNGRRRKRCERCMARALNQMAFKRKSCSDCWESDVGYPAHDLFFLRQVDISNIPREVVPSHYVPEAQRGSSNYNYYHSRLVPWELIYFFRPALQAQLTTQLFVNQTIREPAIINFAKKFIRDLESEADGLLRSLGQVTDYKYASNYARKDKWYVPVIHTIISVHECVQRHLENILTDDLGVGFWKKLTERGCKYKRLPKPAELYGEGTDIQKTFPKTICEISSSEEYKDMHGVDHPDCDFKCVRKSRAEQFKKLYWPDAEKRLLDMFIGENSLMISAEEVAAIKNPQYTWSHRPAMTVVIESMVAACQWVVPEDACLGEYSRESMEKWNSVHGDKGKKRK